ncbi:1,5-anhydro-D-fructose reductase-like [Centruroides vittatus]|uniref:1,5-anhydro-D-fructose reductase-like n=1 Tax=Centruroides vittatus TaxID=120091 RepID=UPI003510039D
MGEYSNYITLNNGLNMPLIGLGTFQSNRSAMETALKIGYRLIDTAFIYQNEQEIGEALKHSFDTNVVRREDVFIVSKLPNNGHRNVKYFLQKSLDALQLQYLDLYLIHTPFAVKGNHDLDMYPVENGRLVIDEEVNYLETWKKMEEVVRLGMTKSIGLSNFNKDQIEKIYNNSRIKPANVQVECHPYLPQVEIYKFCQENNVSMTAYSPLGAPFLPEFSLKNFGIMVKDFPILLDEPILKTISEKYGKSPAQIILRFLVQKRIAVIPKSCNETRLRENLQILDFSLLEEDMENLGNIKKRFRYYKFNFIPGLSEHPQNPFSET